VTTAARLDVTERKTTGVQKHGRAARVVSRILQAAAEELTRVGYGALRIEEVASKAGVNKTTIYRRWPGKAELVTDAIRGLVSNASPPDTGNLRSDLFAYFSILVKRSHEPMWRGLLITLNSLVEPELEVLAKELRSAARESRREMIQRGIDRGELPRGVDAALVADIVSAPILYQTLHLGDPVDTHYIESVLDVVLAGAAANALRSP